MCVHEWFVHMHVYVSWHITGGQSRSSTLFAAGPLCCCIYILAGVSFWGFSCLYLQSHYTNTGIMKIKLPCLALLGSENTNSSSHMFTSVSFTGPSPQTWFWYYWSHLERCASRFLKYSDEKIECYLKKNIFLCILNKIFYLVKKQTRIIR